MLKSWKTTCAGLAAILTALANILQSIATGTSCDYQMAITGMLAGFGLLFARDNNKTSEDVGAKQ